MTFWELVCIWWPQANKLNEAAQEQTIAATMMAIARAFNGSK